MPGIRAGKTLLQFAIALAVLGALVWGSRQIMVRPPEFEEKALGNPGVLASVDLPHSARPVHGAPEFSDISAAVQAARSGDVLYLKNGVHRIGQSTTLTGSLWMVGEHTSDTVVEISEPHGGIRAFEAEHLLFSNFTWRTRLSYPLLVSQPILARPILSVRIAGCRFQKLGEEGGTALGLETREAVIESCTFDGFHLGITFESREDRERDRHNQGPAGPRGLKVQQCTFDHTREAVYASAARMTLTGNWFHGVSPGYENTHALWLFGQGRHNSRAEIIGNTFVGYGSAMRIGEDLSVDIRSNTFVGARGPVIEAGKMTRGDITRNIFAWNQGGLVTWADTGHPKVFGNLYWRNQGGRGEEETGMYAVSRDPLFGSPGSMDFYLRGKSPALGEGDSSPVFGAWGELGSPAPWREQEINLPPPPPGARVLIVRPAA